MPTNAERAYEKAKAALGQTEGTGEWMEIAQERIDRFADVTEDHQFIHIDPERAAQTPFGTTIAHGFLTLSLLTRLVASIPRDKSRFEGIVMGVNYGFDRVRFVNPVKVGSRIRATSVLKDAELKDPKPALVADWLSRSMYA
jgi:acyl dehydratase